MRWLKTLCVSSPTGRLADAMASKHDSQDDLAQAKQAILQMQRIVKMVRLKTLAHATKAGCAAGQRVST